MNTNNEQYLELLILKNLNREISQYSLAKEIGHSVGKVNYVLKALIAKGLVKAEKFAKSKNKYKYTYLLTPEGIKQKIDITEKFIKKSQEEYETLKKDLERYKELYPEITK